MEFLKYSKTRYLSHLLSAPFIYVAFIGFVVFDLFLELYHRICFPLYGLEIIDRKKYFKFDRRKLPYLSILDRFNCMYCSYGNGLMTYASEIVSQTEKYWCGIKHKETEGFIAPTHHDEFLEYGDEKAFYEKYGKYKEECNLLQQR